MKDKDDHFIYKKYKKYINNIQIIYTFEFPKLKKS